MPLYIPLTIPQGGALNAVDNTGAINPVLLVDQSDNSVQFLAGSNGELKFADNTGSTVFASDPDVFEMYPGTVIRIFDDSFNDGPVLGLDGSFNLFIQAHPTTGVINLIDSSGNVVFTTKQSATTPDPGANGTISTTGIGVARVTPASARTGVILQAGVTPGQEVVVVNNSASNSITFAAVATSHVADGTSAVIAANKCMFFKWDSIAAKWYHS